jgi:hypothetical protein
MAIIQFKRRSSGAAGGPAALKSGEPAYNMLDKTLYFGFGDDGTGNATSVIAIAGEGAFVTLGTSQTVAGAKVFSGAVDLTSAVATAATQIVSDNSAKLATTAYVQSQFTAVSAGTYTKLTIDAKGRVTAVGFAVSADIIDFNTAVRATRLDQMATPTSAVSFGGVNLTSLADPVNNTDAATKQWVVNQVATAAAHRADQCTRQLDLARAERHLDTSNRRGELFADRARHRSAGERGRDLWRNGLAADDDRHPHARHHRALMVAGQSHRHLLGR